MNQEELARAAEAFEAQEQLNTEEPVDEAVNEPTEEPHAAEEGDALPVVQTERTELAERTVFPQGGNFGDVVGSVSHDILARAQEKISDEKIVDKHAENLKKVADRALEVEAQRADLTVQEQDADNKVRKQEIRNRLIVLKAEAKRLEKEQKQLNREQKADHKARNKAAKWELYKGKLERMHYTYVPCAFVLGMLLFFDGVRSFFEGLATVSTAMAKAFKWVLIIGAVLLVLLAVLLAIPVTREWLTNLLSGGH